MFAILAEDDSDAQTLVILVKQIADQENLKVFRKGFKGCGNLLKGAASQIEELSERGASRFIICHDSDGQDPKDVREAVRRSVKASRGCNVDLKELAHAIIVPVQELEAWIIADPKAIASAIPSLVIAEVRWPETIPNPKEWLVAQSRGGRSKPLYVPAIFNEKVAAHLDIKKVWDKCPSFRELVEFVRET